MLPGKNYRQKMTVALLLLLPLFPATLFADEFSPALLEMTERDGGWVDVIWKVPTRGKRVLPLVPILPDFLEPIGPGAGRAISGAWLKSSSYNSRGQSLTGASFYQRDEIIQAFVLVQFRLLIRRQRGRSTLVQQFRHPL